MSDIVWDESIHHEVAYWDGVIAREANAGSMPRKPSIYHSNWIRSTFVPPVPPDETIRILNVESGPFGHIGIPSPDENAEVIHTHALGDILNRLLDKHGLMEFPRIRNVPPEMLSAEFGHDIFHCVYCNNALDRFKDPARAFAEMIAVCRPGARIHLTSVENQAERERYSGTHQWNLELDGAHLWLWNKYSRRDLISENADVDCMEAEYVDHGQVGYKIFTATVRKTLTPKNPRSTVGTVTPPTNGVETSPPSMEFRINEPSPKTEAMQRVTYVDLPGSGGSESHRPCTIANGMAGHAQPDTGAPTPGESTADAASAVSRRAEGMSVASPQTRTDLTGAIDTVHGPRAISGWVGSYTRAIGNEVEITVLRDGRVIGRGRPTYQRSGVKHVIGSAMGFRITCQEDIPDEALAFGGIAAEAKDAAGDNYRLSIYDRLQTSAFFRVLERLPEADNTVAQGVLAWLARSAKLSETNVARLLACRDALRPPLSAPSSEAAAPVAKDAAAEAERRFWFRFESLGADCTLGTVQRLADAEPLGLLRFAGIGVDAVCRAIEDDFAGVGSPEFTRVEPNEQHEYMSRDTRYHMQSHIFIYEGEISYERLLQQQCKKIAYLARNLVDDIAEGDKIFVVHSLPGEIEPGKIQRLHALLRARGPGWLLQLRVGNDAHPAGTAVREADGLISGYVADPRTVTDLDRQESWRAACRAAAAIVDA